MRQALTLLIALGAVLALSLAACKQGDNSAGSGGSTDTSVKIGLFVSTSGDVKAFGDATKEGVDLAVEEINKAGGIKGKTIDLVFYDIASKPEEAGTAAVKLATEDKVLVAMGAVASSLSLAAAPVFEENGVPMISPSSTNPTVTQQGKNIFRICYLDDFQGAALATFAHKDLKAAKAAILYNQDDPYSTGLAQFFQKRFESLGGEVMKPETYKKGTSDFNTQVSNIKGKGADVIFVPGYYNDVALIAKQFRGQGVDTTILGGDGWESPTLIPQSDGALEGCYFGNHYSQGDSRKVVQDFVKAYKDKYGHTPTSLAALGYDVVKVVQKAIEDAGEFDRAKVADALRNLKSFEGVTGNFSIDKDRNARKPISILKIKGEGFEAVRQIMPEEVEN